MILGENEESATAPTNHCVCQSKHPQHAHGRPGRNTGFTQHPDSVDRGPATFASCVRCCFMPVWRKMAARDRKRFRGADRSRGQIADTCCGFYQILDTGDIVSQLFRKSVSILKVARAVVIHPNAAIPFFKDEHLQGKVNGRTGSGKHDRTSRPRGEPKIRSFVLSMGNPACSASPL